MLLYDRTDQRIRQERITLVDVVEQPIVGVNIVDVFHSDKEAMDVQAR